MQEHLFQSVQLVESCFPDCTLIVVGDCHNTSVINSIDEHLKLLILKWQKDFQDGSMESMPHKFNRNAINHERKSFKASFYKSNAKHMKEENPKIWWKVRSLYGFNSNSGRFLVTSILKELKILRTRILEMQSTRPFLSLLKNITCTNHWPNFTLKRKRLSLQSFWKCIFLSY